MSPVKEQAIFIKRVILDNIKIFSYSVMPFYQQIEKNENIAKRNFFEFACFLTGLINAIFSIVMLPTMAMKITVRIYFK
jgi:hypothetical protein